MQAVTARFCALTSYILQENKNKHTHVFIYTYTQKNNIRLVTHNWQSPEVTIHRWCWSKSSVRFVFVFVRKMQSTLRRLQKSPEVNRWCWSKFSVRFVFLTCILRKLQYWHIVQNYHGENQFIHRFFLPKVVLCERAPGQGRCPPSLLGSMSPSVGTATVSLSWSLE